MPRSRPVRRRRSSDLKWYHVLVGILIALMIVGLPVAAVLIALRLVP
jgi:hypothetical protein